MKKILIVLVCGFALMFSVSNASALSVGDANYIGRIVDGVPPGSNEDEYVNSLLALAPGAVDPQCNFATSEACDRIGSTLNVAGFPAAVEAGQLKDESGGNTVNLGAVGSWTYLLAKYGAGATGEQFSVVWYVGNLGGTQTVLPSQALSHWTLFNPGVTVPDGGATLGLLGLGMLGLGYLRRRKQ